MSRLTSDLSPVTYVVNPGTLFSTSMQVRGHFRESEMVPDRFPEP